MRDFKKLFDDYLIHCEFEKKLSFNTIKAYRIDLSQFLDFINKKSKILNTHDLNKETIKEYLRFLQEKNKFKTVKRKLASIKAFFNYAEYEDLINKNPFNKLRIKIKEPFILPRILFLSEVKRIFNTIYEIKNGNNKNNHIYKNIIRDIVVFELLFATGIRVSELCNLCKKDINIEQGFIHVKGKGNKERLIQICHNEIIDVIKEFKELFHIDHNNNSFFLLNRSKQRLSEQSVRLIIKKYVKLSELKKNITPHMFRHTFATLLLEEGVDIRYIQQFLGHSSIVTTQIYTHVTRKKTKEILTSKHPRINFQFTDSLS